ncbi:MAG: hypothetical protein ABJB11_14545 [Ferruginibacter sp.]
MKSTTLFKFLLYFDAVLFLIVLIGFLYYILKGPVYSSVTGTWLFVLMLLALFIAAGFLLNSFHHTTLALIPLFIVAAPGILYLCIMMIINVFKIT